MRFHARCITVALLAGASRTYTASAHAVSPILGTEDADSQPYLPYFMPDRQIYPMDMMQKCHYRKVLQGTCFTCTGSTQGIDSRGWRQGWRSGPHWNPMAGTPRPQLSTSHRCGEWMRMAGMQVFQHEGMSLVCFVEVVIAFNHLSTGQSKAVWNTCAHPAKLWCLRKWPNFRYWLDLQGGAAVVAEKYATGMKMAGLDVCKPVFLSARMGVMRGNL